MDAITITPKELKMLNAIVHDEYQPLNGGSPDEYEDLGPIYVWSVAESKSEGGVLSSLIRKGLVVFQPEPSEDDLVWVTEEGYKVWVDYVKNS